MAKTRPLQASSGAGGFPTSVGPFVAGPPVIGGIQLRGMATFDIAYWRLPSGT